MAISAIGLSFDTWHRFFCVWLLLKEVSMRTMWPIFGVPLQSLSSGRDYSPCRPWSFSAWQQLSLGVYLQWFKWHGCQENRASCMGCWIVLYLSTCFHFKVHKGNHFFCLHFHLVTKYMSLLLGLAITPSFFIWFNVQYMKNLSCCHFCLQACWPRKSLLFSSG